MTEHQPTTGDDVEGYGFKRAFAEGDQAGDDVEGHGFRGSLVVEDREANDVEGHSIKTGRNARAGRYADSDGGDDVEGHLSGALGAQKRDEQP
jgi:hypothetical protein